MKFFLLINLSLFYINCNPEFYSEEIILPQPENPPPQFSEIDQDGEFPCFDEGCLFKMIKTEGKIVYLSCFDRFAITAKSPNDSEIFIYGIPENLTDEFNESGKTVTFTSNFYENTLSPTGPPDPLISMESIYKIVITSIE